jgi:hypothetical protein
MPSTRGHRAQQVAQVGAVVEVHPVAVHDLAQQHDLAHALAGQRAHFGHDVVERPAALRAAAVGDDAETAGVGAAEYDGHLGGDRTLLQGGQGQILVLHGVAPRALLLLGLAQAIHQAARMQEIQQGRGVGGRHKNVHIGEARLQGGRFAHAHHAAHEADDHVRAGILAGLEGGQATHRLVLRLLAHHAGVQHHQVGGFRGGGGHIAGKLNLLGQAARIRLVHLAAGRPNVIGAWCAHAQSCPPRSRQGANVHHEGPLFQPRLPVLPYRT